MKTKCFPSCTTTWICWCHKSKCSILKSAFVETEDFSHYGLSSGLYPVQSFKLSCDYDSLPRNQVSLKKMQRHRLAQSSLAFKNLSKTKWIPPKDITSSNYVYDFWVTVCSWKLLILGVVLLCNRHNWFWTIFQPHSQVSHQIIKKIPYKSDF